MKTFLMFLLAIGSLGFVLLIGYAIFAVIRDFGMGAGWLATTSAVIGFVSLGFLIDSQGPKAR